MVHDLRRRLSKAAVLASGAAGFLLLLLFVAFCLLPTRQASAEDVACSGKDLVAELAQTDPQSLQRIRAEAAQTPNSTGLLWRIEKDGQAPSYLFGTMHVADPRVVRLPPAAQQAFNEAETLVIETTDALDQAKMMAAMAERPDLTMFTDQTTLRSLLDAGDQQVVEAGLKARGISLASVNKMKPWMLAAMLATPDCELARRTAGQAVLDQQLAIDAEAAGKKLAGLESALDQLSAMAELPLPFHIRSLVDTLALGDRLNDVNETMIQLYLRGEIGLLWPLLDHILPQSDAEGYAEFEQVLIVKRNKTMAKRAEPILREGKAFIAVGALHLPGEEGLVALLRHAGYRLTPVH